jgi:hypothetical protein
MKTYNSNEIYKWNWLKKQDYIHSSDSLGDPSKIGWKLFEKFPIHDIQYNPVDYPNELDLSLVIHMITEFYPFGFHPIRIDKNFKLRDGQHRLKFAQLCNFKFIDVWIDSNKDFNYD